MLKKSFRGTIARLIATGLFLSLAANHVHAQTIVDEWATVKAPPAPTLKPVTITPQEEIGSGLSFDYLPNIHQYERE